MAQTGEESPAALTVVAGVPGQAGTTPRRYPAPTHWARVPPVDPLRFGAFPPGGLPSHDRLVQIRPGAAADRDDAQRAGHPPGHAFGSVVVAPAAAAPEAILYLVLLASPGTSAH